MPTVTATPTTWTDEVGGVNGGVCRSNALACDKITPCARPRPPCGLAPNQTRTRSAWYGLGDSVTAAAALLLLPRPFIACPPRSAAAAAPAAAVFPLPPATGAPGMRPAT
eukprot:COSAG01_NODE_257_length_20101_cov_142.726427_25_plen_110_part_00